MKNTENNEEIPKLLTLKEACEILKCHPNTLRQWDKKGIPEQFYLCLCDDANRQARRQRWPCDHPYPFRDMTVQVL